MTTDKNYVILRTYRPVWKISRKMYSVEGFKLPFPVNPNEAIYFAVSIAISILLVKLIPLYNNLHFVLKFGVVPFGLMKFLTKQKLDGKMPHKFLYDLINYLINPKKYSRFKQIDNIKSIRFTTPIVYRNREIKDKTQKALAKLKPKNNIRRE